MSFIVVCTLIFSILLYLPQPWWWLEIFTHFTLLLCMISVACLLYYLYKKQTTWVIGSLISTSLSLLPLMQFVTIGNTVNTSELLRDNFSIYNANVLSTNDTPEKILQQIIQTQPDVITIQEFSFKIQSSLFSLKTSYPYQILQPQHDNFGIALYSKYPILSHQILYFDSLMLPSIEAVVQIPQNDHSTKPIKIITTHPMPPLGQSMFLSRNIHLKQLTNHIIDQTLPLIVTGDFNITPFSFAFKRLINDTKLIQARNNNGLLHSWPSKLVHIPILSLPIDHILISDKFHNFDIQILEYNGSDHRPLFLTIQW
ncbi:endonuclease/exonuclease/phosphatase family protein [Marinicellulosiphila megalodicopiae]|uniref:endonuclease/exonuclease/phosphatase family protein n=1 Tax=Marinicellulosiphila megalodicopiae TaxID=2724896 RepID=UPI003BB06393